MLEEIKGRTVVINKPSYAIYTALSDLNNIAAALPEQYRDKVTIGQMPFPFLLSFFTEPADDNTTYFHIELRAELNTLMKMMFGKRLQEIVDKLTDGVSAAASGQVPEGWEQYAQGKF